MGKKNKVDEEKINRFIEEFDREHGYKDDDEEDDTTTAAAPKAETTAERIARLEAEVAAGRRALADNFSVEALRAQDAKTAELDDLKQRVAREKALKDRYWLRYSKSFMTLDEFERRWESELRDKAIQEDAADADTQEASKHSAYGGWWN